LSTYLLVCLGPPLLYFGGIFILAAASDRREARLREVSRNLDIKIRQAASPDNVIRAYENLRGGSNPHESATNWQTVFDGLAFDKIDLKSIGEYSFEIQVHDAKAHRESLTKTESGRRELELLQARRRTDKPDWHQLRLLIKDVYGAYYLEFDVIDEVERRISLAAAVPGSY
jgi:hypothetical protein